MEENDFLNNHDQQKARTADISKNTSHTFTNDNDIYLVEHLYPISHTLVLLCHCVLWFSLTKAKPDIVPVLNLRPLDECSQPQHLAIFGFPSLKNCSRSVLQQKATATTFRGEVLRYSPWY